MVTVCSAWIAPRSGEPRHGVRCSKCAQPARLEMTFAEQTCYICFEVATANDISGVEDIANEILCD